MLSCMHPRAPEEDVDVTLEKRKTLGLRLHPATLRRFCAQSAWANTVLASHLPGGAVARLNHSIPAEHFLDAGCSRQDEKGGE
jgi:hypothetical protein